MMLTKKHNRQLAEMAALQCHLRGEYKQRTGRSGDWPGAGVAPMTSKEEKKRRKALVRAWQEQEQTTMEAEADERLPFPRQDLVHLFRYVDDRWDEHGCDHTLGGAIEYLNKIGLPKDQREDVLDWLIEQGGGCDCEILANVAERWIDAYNPEEWSFEGV
jgi:hypothetical protein